MDFLTDFKFKISKKDHDKFLKQLCSKEDLNGVEIGDVVDDIASSKFIDKHLENAMLKNYELAELLLDQGSSITSRSIKNLIYSKRCFCLKKDPIMNLWHENCFSPLWKGFSLVKKIIEKSIEKNEINPILSEKINGYRSVYLLANGNPFLLFKHDSHFFKNPLDYLNEIHSYSDNSKLLISLLKGQIGKEDIHHPMHGAYLLKMAIDLNANKPINRREVDLNFYYNLSKSAGMVRVQHENIVKINDENIFRLIGDNYRVFRKEYLFLDDSEKEMFKYTKKEILSLLETACNIENWESLSISSAYFNEHLRSENNPNFNEESYKENEYINIKQLLEAIGETELVSRIQKRILMEISDKFNNTDVTIDKSKIPTITKPRL